MTPKDIARLITEDPDVFAKEKEMMEFIQHDLESRGYGASYHEDSDSYTIVGNSRDYYAVMKATRFNQSSKVEVSIMPINLNRQYPVKRISFGIYDTEKMKRAMDSIESHVGNK